jgi:hypothetical protein
MALTRKTKATLVVLATTLLLACSVSEGDRCNPLRSSDECGGTTLTCTTIPICGSISICCPTAGPATNPNCGANPPCADIDASTDAAGDDAPADAPTDAAKE